MSRPLLVVLDALSRMDGEVAKRSKHLAHGMVKLPGAKKMSSRKGKIVEAEWLLNEVKKKVEDVMRESKRWDEGQIAQVSDIISVASIKYSFIKVSVGKDVIFDIEKSTSFDGDTGPYLLYVYARCNSILNEKSVDQRGSTQIRSAYQGTVESTWQVSGSVANLRFKLFSKLCCFISF